MSVVGGKAMTLNVIILAAGKGKRMLSHIPKVMHTIGGESMLSRVIRTAQSLHPSQMNIVYGNGGSDIPNAFPQIHANWVHQYDQLGTGHAVMQALPFCKDKEQILVLYGDVPFISTDTLKKLLTVAQEKKGIGLLVATLPHPKGFGRIIRDKQNHITAIIEEKDATLEQRAIQEINTGIITAPVAFLKKLLPKIENHNAQKEYYLTDVIALFVQSGYPIADITATDLMEIRGVNDLWQLMGLERDFQQRRAQELAYNGVIIVDHTRLDIRGNVDIASAVQLEVNVILEGNVKIGAGSKIGPNVYIKNSIIGEQVTVLANSVIEGATIENHCSVGPFARIRTGTLMRTQSKIGNFVETKATILGENSKASHLTYLGDATIGKNVNIGAGTITCNYDGINKWPTEIGDGAFIGSNTSLIAPIQVGENATIAAGSAVSKHVPPEQLTIVRAKQETAKHWKRPSKKNPVLANKKLVD